MTFFFCLFAFNCAVWLHVLEDNKLWLGVKKINFADLLM